MKKIKMIILIIFLSLAILQADKIKVGMSADFSGPIPYIGNNILLGINTYLKEINNSFDFVFYDDQYNPLIASENVRKLISEDNVDILFANVGTPTTNVVKNVLEEENIVLFAPYSGGSSLRQKEENRYIFNFRASYSQEAYYLVNNLLSLGIKPEEIAVFSQNDTYGDSGFHGVLKAFREVGFKNLNDVAHVRYTRGTVNIENALSQLLDYNIDFKAIVMVSVDKPSIKFVEYAKEDFPKLKFFFLSPTNIVKIAQRLPKYEKDIYSTQVVPVLSSPLRIVKEYKQSLKKYYPHKKANLISLEGYIITKLFFDYIRDIKKNQSSKKEILKSLKSPNLIDIGLGFKSNFNNEAHQFSTKVWFSKTKENVIIEAFWNEIMKDM